MRIPSVVFFVCFSTTLALGQGSTRLLGMGNVSIAVPDPQSEFLSNPAKISQIGGLMIQANPMYSPYSMAYESDAYTPSSPSSSSSSGSDLSANDARIQALTTISFDLIHIGAVAGTSSTSHSNSRHSQSSSGSYQSSYSQTTENKISMNSFQAIAAIDLGFLSVGASGKLTPSTNTSNDNYSNSNSGSSSSISEYEDEATESPRSFMLGAVIGSPSSFEASAVFEVASSNREKDVKKNIYNGVTQGLTNAPVYYGAFSGSRLQALARMNFGTLLLAARITRMGETYDYSTKQLWFPPTGSPVNEERKSSSDEITTWEYGAGVSVTLPNVGIFAAEFVHAPMTDQGKNYATSTYTGSNGRIFNQGDVTTEVEFTYTTNAIRCGVEFQVSEGFKLRGGPEVVWYVVDFSSNVYSYYNARSNAKGMRTSQFGGYGGAAVSLGVIRFDYALKIAPEFSSTNYSGSGPTSYGNDIRFTHYLTATIIL